MCLAHSQCSQNSKNGSLWLCGPGQYHMMLNMWIEEPAKRVSLQSELYEGKKQNNFYQEFSWRFSDKLLKWPLSLQCAMWCWTCWWSVAPSNFQQFYNWDQIHSRSTQANGILCLGCHRCQTLHVCHLHSQIHSSKLPVAATEDLILQFISVLLKLLKLSTFPYLDEEKKKTTHLPGIDFRFRSPHAGSWIASQQLVQCLCHAVDGSIHTESCALHCLVCHQANISQW